jgi:radical SAM protein with 4Fe4S-binding SPASM domain
MRLPLVAEEISIPAPPPRDTAPPRPTRKLAPGVYLVHGARNAAIYDLNKKEVLWIERDALLALERGDPVVGDLASRTGLGIAAIPGASPGTDEALPLARRRTLDFLWIELTEGCNLACGHCYASSGGEHRTVLSTEGYGRVLDQAKELGCQTVQLTGGEPLVHPDLLALVDRARGHGLDVEIYSNLALLGDALADALAARGVRLATSFYSDRAEDHEALTRVAGSFEQTCAGMRRALSRRIPLRVGVVLQGEGRARRAETTAFLATLGVVPAAITFDEIRPEGRGTKDAPPPGPPPAEKDTCRTSEERSYRRPLAVTPDGRVRGGNCWGGELDVNARGEVTPCIFERKLALGRVGADGEGFARIASGDGARSLWSIALEDCRVCRDCEFRYSCFDCRFLAYRTSGGDLYAKPPGCTYDPYRGRYGGEGAVSDRVPRRRRELVVEEVEDGLVVLDEKKGDAHALNATAAAIFELLDGTRDLAALARFIAGTTGASEERVLADVKRAIDELAAKGLLEA